MGERRGRGEHMLVGNTSKGVLPLHIHAVLPKIPRQCMSNINSISVLEKFLQLTLKLVFECISESLEKLY